MLKSRGLGEIFDDEFARVPGSAFRVLASPAWKRLVLASRALVSARAFIVLRSSVGGMIVGNRRQGHGRRQSVQWGSHFSFLFTELVRRRTRLPSTFIRGVGAIVHLLCRAPPAFPGWCGRCWKRCVAVG